jgi:predicted transcriptional regulator
MNAILLRGKSKTNTRLLLQLARKLDFETTVFSEEQLEDLGIVLSIEDGLKSGLLDENEKSTFLQKLSRPL